MSGLQVTLGGVTFNNGTPDANGCTWWMDRFDGWDSPELRQVLLDPTGTQGSVVASSTLAPRGLIVGGTVKAPNDTAFWQAYGKLSLISNNLFTTRDMTVVEVPTTKRVSFVRGGKVRKEIKPGRVDFEIPLLAPDPRKYNDTEDTAALAGTITNEGDFETHPTLTLTAGGDYTITNTTQGAGASLVIVGAPVGAVVDMKLRTVLLGAVDYYSTVQPQSIWWTLLPGANIITKSGGAASITWRDAWI